MIELTPADAPLLQRFFDANPEYFLATQGTIAGPDEADEELRQPIPDGWSYTKQWRLGWREPGSALAAMANVTSDLLAKGVWHIGLLILATPRHGNGDAQVIYRDLEQWARSNGAAWLRLGVVHGNARAERFWESVGFREARRRTGVQMGERSNTLRVMFKPLRRGTLHTYLKLVPRDRPE